MRGHGGDSSARSAGRSPHPSPGRWKTPETLAGHKDEAEGLALRPEPVQTEVTTLGQASALGPLPAARSGCVPGAGPALALPGCTLHSPGRGRMAGGWGSEAVGNLGVGSHGSG